MKNKLFVFLPIFAAALSSCGQKQYTPSQYISSIEYDTENFKILVLSDIHLGQTDKVEDHLKLLDMTIRDASADLIVLNGDIFTFADKRIVREFFTFINNYQTPWTMTFGNHDEQGYYDDTYLPSIIPTYSYARFIDYADDKVAGEGNFVINLVKGGVLKHQVFLMDSHGYHFDDYWGYDFIQQNQIDWYKEMIEYTNKQINPAWKVGDPTVESSAFFHIALPEYVEMMQQYKDGLIPGEATFREGCGGPKHNSGFFQTMLDYKSTKTVVVAHDHRNAGWAEYKGVKLAYDVKSTDRVYSDPDLIGGMVVTVKNDSSTEISTIFHTYEEVK